MTSGRRRIDFIAAEQRLIAYAQNYLGVAELSGILDITRQAIGNRIREHRIPVPSAHLRMGPIWTREKILAWIYSQSQTAQLESQ